MFQIEKKMQWLHSTEGFSRVMKGSSKGTNVNTTCECKHHMWQQNKYLTQIDLNGGVGVMSYM